jgi:hypothetical protein
MESLMMRPFDALFAKQMSTAGLFSWIPFSNNPLKKCEWISPMHVLQQKFPDKTWFSWIVIKGDVIKMHDILQEILVELNSNYELHPDVVNKNVCQSRNLTPIPVGLLPVNAFGELILNTNVEHPLLPVICFNFFKAFFSSTATEGSLGYRFLSEAMMKALKIKMSQMADHHHKEWSKSQEQSFLSHHSENTKLYRAFTLWLEESHLHDAYVDFSQLPPHFCTDILKAAMEGASEAVVMNYVDNTSSFEREEHLLQVWLEIKEFDANVYPLVLDFSHFALLQEDAVKNCPVLTNVINEILLSSPDDPSVVEGAGLAVLCLLQHNIKFIMDEERLFAKRLDLFRDLNKQYLQLIPEKLKNVSKESVVRGTCDKNDECCGSACIVLTFSEATENNPVVKELERNRIEYNKLLSDLLSTPSDKSVTSVILTQRYMQVLSRSCHEEDRRVFQHLCQYLSCSIESNGSQVFPPAKHLFDCFFNQEVTEDPETRLVNGHFFLPNPDPNQ